MITENAHCVSDWIAAQGLALEILFSEPDTIDVMQLGKEIISQTESIALRCIQSFDCAIWQVNWQTTLPPDGMGKVRC